MAVLSKSPTPAELNGGKDSKNVEIAEVIVGAILGKDKFEHKLQVICTYEQFTLFNKSNVLTNFKFLNPPITHAIQLERFRLV